jgi:hypothetical protein
LALWVVAAIVMVGLAALFFVRYHRLPASVRAPSSPPPGDAILSVPARIPEKSIAVLPFDNLSDEKQNAYFAVGIQDEIMSNLARIADLKVISRTSANLRDIALMFSKRCDECSISGFVHTSRRPAEISAITAAPFMRHGPG